MTDRKPHPILLPVCWARGHAPEGESLIEARTLADSTLRRCGRCGRYILRTSIGEMVLTEKIALEILRREHSGY